MSQYSQSLCNDNASSKMWDNSININALKRYDNSPQIDDGTNNKYSKAYEKLEDQTKDQFKKTIVMNDNLSEGNYFDSLM